MSTYTVRVQDRNPCKIKLTIDEARAMEQAGFRFSIFDEESQRFELSIPYQLAEDRARLTVTFMQG